MLATQRSLRAEAGEGTILDAIDTAVIEAWERGLLIPKVADVRLLDWGKTPIVNLASFAKALGYIVQEGLLSVVWPILDSLLEISLQNGRMLAGTAEVAESIAELLPEVLYAVDRGKADPSALELPGIRTLALRPGDSRAVRAAKGIAALLPPA